MNSFIQNIIIIDKIIYCPFESGETELKVAFCNIHAVMLLSLQYLFLPRNISLAI